MAAPDDRSHRGGTKGDLGRAERLAAELRANLKRRKAQGRARDAGASETPSDETASPKGRDPSQT